MSSEISFDLLEPSACSGIMICTSSSVFDSFVPTWFLRHAAAHTHCPLPLEWHFMYFRYVVLLYWPFSLCWCACWCFGGLQRIILQLLPSPTPQAATSDWSVWTYSNFRGCNTRRNFRDSRETARAKRWGFEKARVNCTQSRARYLKHKNHVNLRAARKPVQKGREHRAQQESRDRHKRKRRSWYQCAHVLSFPPSESSKANILICMFFLFPFYCGFSATGSSSICSSFPSSTVPTVVDSPERIIFIRQHRFVKTRVGRGWRQWSGKIELARTGRARPSHWSIWFWSNR